VAGSGEKAVIENFWLEAIDNHPHLSSMVQDQDKPALAALKDIKCIVHPDVRWRE
jgi:hypothetical protein